MSAFRSSLSEEVRSILTKKPLLPRKSRPGTTRCALWGRSAGILPHVCRLVFYRRCSLAAALLLAGLSGCARNRPATGITDLLAPGDFAKMVAPSNHRQWVPSLAVLPHAEFHGNHVTIRNIRHCEYLSEQDYIVRHYDKTFDLDRVQSVDFWVVPFQAVPSLAHTMLSFGFGDQGYLAVSVEARLEEGESYSPIRGAMRQYELMYVLADERDVIPLRTNHRESDVYLYRTRATPAQARVLLLDVLARVNKLAVEPEFYDTFTNNCTTNIVQHINRVYPSRIPMRIGVLLPGYADRLAYDLGLLDSEEPFERVRQRALVNVAANRYANSPEFSRKIRR